MTVDEAQAQAPSFLRLPDNLDHLSCSCCKQDKLPSELVLAFVPERYHEHQKLICMGCIDEHWFAHAKDCGVYIDSNPD